MNQPIDHTRGHPLATLAASPPALEPWRARGLLSERFGLEGQLLPLPGERDLNIRVDIDGRPAGVLKVSAGPDAMQEVDRQVSVLEHLAGRDPAPPVPPLLRTRDGRACVQLELDGRPAVAWLIGWLPGDMLDGIELNPALCGALGRALAQLGRALADCPLQPGTYLPWDFRNTPHLRELLPLVADQTVAATIADCLQAWQERVAPVSAALPAQLVHHDFNPANVLVDAASASVTGVIDFGDMQRAPLVHDVAVACAYLRSSGEDPLEHIRPFVAAYQREQALPPDEIALLYDLIRLRLATTVSLLAWRASVREEGEAYLAAAAESEADAAPFLARLTAVGRDEITARLLDV